MQHHQMAGGAFALDQLALAAVRSTSSAAQLQAQLDNAIPNGGEAFQHFLIENGLASLWVQALQTHDSLSANALAFRSSLRQAHLSGVAMYLAQQAALREVDGLFASQSISYALMKGGHVRELVYDEPALRPATDLDILIHPEQREVASKILMEAGFQFHPDPANISHEAMFSRGGVDIDLHWDILRPGRTRFEVTDSFLSRRRRFDGFWGLDDTDAVFLMLTHPAFAKYVCSPNMSLNRVVDFIFWVRKRDVDWSSVANRLEETGLKAAAWTVLRWISMLIGPEDLPVPYWFVSRLRPGRIRSRYLGYWLDHDLPTRWLHRPLLIQLGLTLFLHDRPSDAWRAILQWVQARSSGHQDPLIRTHG